MNDTRAERSHRVLRLATLVLLIHAGISSGALGQSLAVDTPGGLFVAAEGAPPVLPGALIDTSTLRVRLVEVNRELLQTARVTAGAYRARSRVPPRLRLDLFEDRTFDVVVQETGPTSAGYWLGGHLVGDEVSDVTLVVNRGIVVGTVRATSGVYRMSTVSDGVLAVRQVDSDRLLRGPRPPVRSAASPADSRIQPVMPPAIMPPAAPRPERNVTDVPGGPEDGARIDILAVYTPTATALYGGPDEIKAELDLAIAEANQAYANSGVALRLNLVFATEVSYTPHNDGETNVARLQDPNDGYLDEVHDMRDRHAADIVTLEPGGNHIIGVSFDTMRDPSPGFESSAFTSMGFSGYGFAHEFGHLQGLSHDRYQTTKETNEDLSEHKPYPYAFGYVNQVACEPDAQQGQRWVTIMAYFTQILDDQDCRPTGPLVPRMRFSNPTQTYNGDPLGVPGTEPSSSVAGPADARRTLNRTRRIVANFRVAPCLTDGTWVRLQASSGEYVVVAEGEVLANRGQPGPLGRFEVFDENGGCVESGDYVSLRTTDGLYLIVVHGSLDNRVETASYDRPETDARVLRSPKETERRSNANRPGSQR